jgi:hypothetical protein
MRRDDGPTWPAGTDPDIAADPVWLMELHRDPLATLARARLLTRSDRDRDPVTTRPDDGGLKHG